MPPLRQTSKMQLPSKRQPAPGQRSWLWIRIHYFLWFGFGIVHYFLWISSLKAFSPSRTVGSCAVRNLSAFLCDASPGSLAVIFTCGGGVQTLSDERRLQPFSPYMPPPRVRAAPRFAATLASSSIPQSTGILRYVNTQM